jgi:hypothetical protein
MSLAMADPLLQFNGKTFAAQLHTIFQVHAGSAAPFHLELTEVNEHQSPPGIESFSVVFRGPRAPRLEQKTYRFEHAALGPFDLFITAISGDDQGICYEAVFNRVHKKTP